MGAPEGDNPQLQQLWVDARNAVKAVTAYEQIDPFRVSWLGRQGHITLKLRELGQMDAKIRPAAGAELNRIKNFIAEAVEAKKQELKPGAVAHKTLDLNLPGRSVEYGGLHPCTRVMDDIEHIFTRLGYQIETGFEIEHEYYNFDALNIPANHPARTMHDTVYVDAPADPELGRVLLRTHTSPVQIRVMEKADLPLYIVSSGRTYRSDAADATHTPMFHQMEGLAVDRDMSFADLKGTVQLFLRTFFGDNISIRFRPSYFPFTEPSAEVDVLQEGGDSSDWLEVMGCGMVHPNVLRSSGIDPQQYSGFAFGMGIERLAMIKYKIADLRTLFAGDLHYLEQFSG